MGARSGNNYLSALRKLKIRFSDGERKFLAAKAKLAIVQNE